MGAEKGKLARPASGGETGSKANFSESRGVVSTRVSVKLLAWKGTGSRKHRGKGTMIGTGVQTDGQHAPRWQWKKTQYRERKYNAGGVEGLPGKSSTWWFRPAEGGSKGNCENLRSEKKPGFEKNGRRKTRKGETR